MISKKHIARNWPRLTSWLITLTFLITIIATFTDYGVTWDERMQARYGELICNYVSSGFQDKECNEFLDLKYYGALFEGTAGLLSKASISHLYETRHFLIGICALLTLIAVIKTGLLFKNPYVPLFAALSLLTLPRFYGHAFNNSKDMPFACGFAWAMYAMLKAVQSKQLSWKHALFTGLMIGTTLSLRIGGMLLFFFLFIFLLYYIIIHHKNITGMSDSSKLSNFLLITLTVTIGWSLMVLLWPWAHENPVVNPIRAFARVTNFHSFFPVLYKGSYIMSNKLPWHYMPSYILITTPVALLICMFLSVIHCARTFINNNRSKESMMYFMLLFWICFPLLYFIAKRPNVYDGTRHFLFILPSVAILSGIGAAQIVEMTPQRNRKYTLLAVLFCILLTVPQLVTLHPYQSTYFNSFVGGLKGASGRYETEYWTSSYKEAMEWINDDSQGKETKVLVAANEFNITCAEYYSAPNIKTFQVFKQVPSPQLPNEIDYYLSTTRYQLAGNFPESPIAYNVARNGAVFCVVRRRLALSNEPSKGNTLSR